MYVLMHRIECEGDVFVGVYRSIEDATQAAKDYVFDYGDVYQMIAIECELGKMRHSEDYVQNDEHLIYSGR